MKQIVGYKRDYRIILFIFIFNFLFSQGHYRDMESLLLDIKPFEDDINANYLDVSYNDERIASIKWYDQDSTMFSKVFHYNNQQELFLISELRENRILKEYYFIPFIIAERFINHLFGDSFYTDETYITEIRYNKSNSPIYYRFKSKKDEYIGHITLNYDEENILIREAWFQGKRKIREFSH